MNIAEIFIWEVTNLLLLIPLVIGLVIVARWFQGRPVFTDRDGRWFARPHPRAIGDRTVRHKMGL
jgi:hypothetical protein